MLVLSRQAGESIVINGNVVVTVMSARADKARLGIVAPPEVTINRSEIEASKTEDSVNKPLNEKLEDIRQCIANGYDEDAQEHLFDLIRGLRVKYTPDSELTSQGLALKSLFK